MTKKIISIDSFLELKKKNLFKNKKIVLLSGSFDMFHRGHLEFLEFAKNKGDILVVLLNSDSSVSKYKGKTRPIINQGDRSHILQGICVVDYIIIFDELTPEKYFEKILPDVSCHGSDWSKEFIGIDILRKNNTEINYFKEKDSSSSSIMDKIKKTLNTNDVKAIFYNEKEFSINDFIFVNSKKYKLYKNIDFYNIDNFIEFCVENNININKSFYIGKIKENILFSKKVNLRVIEISSKSINFKENIKNII